MAVAGLCRLCGKPSKKMYTCKLCGNIVCGQCIMMDICRACRQGLPAESRAGGP